ncbi:MFS transporter [Alcaligenes faecalis]|uniref:MFS transporter n=1 Tax=Alcaligenes faecalis TaxID=511 RepID=UPI001D17B0D8|nr:MFS transporter [Alcaligenes faecalis]
MSGAMSGQMTQFENVPFRRFHLRVGSTACGGQFADGFELGIIGLAIALAAVPLNLNAVWMGLLGAAALAGLFLGSLVSGVIVDRVGRRKIFAWDMLFAAVLSIAQFFVTEAWQMLLLRFALGVVLGFDYVVSKALLTELSPVRFRGRLLSIMAIAWVAGYACSYAAGFLLRDLGPDAWRYMLMVSAVPALLIFVFRLGVPESPLWLIRKGRVQEAQEIVRKKLGDGILLPATGPVQQKTGGEWKELFSRKWRKNTAVGGIFYACQVIPYFALGTFLPKILESLNVTDKYVGGLTYNAFLLLGAVIGTMVVDRIARRSFLIATFIAGAAVLSVMAAGVLDSTGVIIAFALFALILSASANLEFIYPPELFPTHLRGTGVGFATATSRFGAAISTFLLPSIVQSHGVSIALGACVVVLLFGALVSYLWAPETSRMRLADV